MNRLEHLMQCLTEECAEVVQASMKCTRFAMDGQYPNGDFNTDIVALELNDIQAVVELLEEHGVVFNNLGSREAINKKKLKVVEMMKVARRRGALQDGGEI